MPSSSAVCLVVLYILFYEAPTVTMTTVDIPSGAASLAFVFDTTGSMGDDLVQAVYGASKILNTTLSLRNRPLYNYVLVPFNDPDIGAVFETTDPAAFQRQLDIITVAGGGDCPEMSIGAIYKAIDVCLPHSYIYVFTDASAKDYNLTDSVIALNQRKQSEVVFLLSGECGDTDGRTAYDTIADSSSGRVFSILKTQVEEVLKSVREEIRTDRVNLVSTSSKHDNSTISLPIDSQLTGITISVNGKNPSINITDPSGNHVIDMKKVLDVDNALIVEVNHLTPGTMKVNVSSEGPHTVRVTGQSSASFEVGVSPKHLIYTNSTSHELLTGYSTYMYIVVYINGTGLRPPAKFSRIELLNVNGSFIREYSLTRNMTEPQIYISPTLKPPIGYFYVKVIGTDENGYEINRLMSAAITGLQPTTPTLSMSGTITGCKGSTITLSCDVDSFIPFSVQWFRQGDPHELVGKERIFLRTATATLEIPDICLSDGGVYICNLTNSVGSVAVSTYLNVTACRDGPTCEPCPERFVCKNCSCPGSVKLLSSPPPTKPCHCPGLVKLTSPPPAKTCSCSGLVKLLSTPPSTKLCHCPSPTKLCSDPTTVKPKCNCTIKTGRDMKQTAPCIDYLHYGIASLIGAGIVLVVELSVVIGCKVARKSKKTTV